MITIWIETFHPKGHIVVVWDALNHFDFLSKFDLSLDQSKLYNNKILTIQFNSLDETLDFLQKMPHETGPYAQIYSLGKLITDNIDK
jgi:hypothetical protein